MGKYDEITAIEQFWNEFRSEVIAEADEYQLELMRTIFFTACSGMYAIMKINVFEKDNTIRAKLDFMKAIESEIREFGKKVTTQTVKH